jgi:hypothetical protein
MRICTEVDLKPSVVEVVRISWGPEGQSIASVKGDRSSR